MRKGQKHEYSVVLSSYVVMMNYQSDWIITHHCAVCQTDPLTNDLVPYALMFSDCGLHAASCHLGEQKHLDDAVWPKLVYLCLIRPGQNDHQGAWYCEVESDPMWCLEEIRRGAAE